MTVLAGGRVVTDRGLMESGWVIVEANTSLIADLVNRPTPSISILAAARLCPGSSISTVTAAGNTFITTDPAEGISGRRDAFAPRDDVADGQPCLW